MWELNGFQRINTGVFATVDSSLRLLGAGSFDWDRSADLLFLNTTTRDVRMWRMDGRTVLHDNYVVTINSLDWKVAGMADFNADGKTELLWINDKLSGPPGNIAIWELDGPTLVNGYPFATYDPQYEIQRTGDVTGDGRADIIWRHKQTGALRLWEMRGRTIVSDRPFHYIPGDLAWQMQSSVGDYNGDGREELLWRNVSAGNPWTGSAAMWELRDGTTLVNGFSIGTSPSPGPCSSPTSDERTCTARPEPTTALR
jgi:FG-GAP-like repeat